jgi:pyrroloquinoline quinone (PQQ) biosynthesis protein C
MLGTCRTPPLEIAVTPHELTAELTAALTGLQLLKHPFYRRWEAGTLNPGELGAYAGQYRHFEASLPATLRRVLAQLDDGPAADLVRRNLADEESNPEPHLALFDRFAEAVDAPAEAAPAATTQALLDTYRRLTYASGAEGLAAVAAYEVQAPAIAASKAEGLRHHYGLDDAATRFWDVHATMDNDHADWAISALAGLPANPLRVIDAAREAAAAWWTFLDGREAAGQAFQLVN